MRASSIVLCGWLLSRAGSAWAAEPLPPASPPSANTPSASAPATAVEPGADLGTPGVPPPSAASAPGAAPAAATGPTAKSADAASEEKFAAAPGPVSDTFATDEGSSGDSDSQRKLDLYGFADFTYQRLLIDKDNVWNRTYPSVNSFAVGNFNVYLSSELGDSWRALAEVRFMYLPNGASKADEVGNAIRTDTTVLDYAGFDEPIRWGGIRIARIYVEHEFNSLFKLQVGQFLTPYGIWNVDHGSPTIIGIKKPFVVANQLFPEQQVGLQLYGSHFFDPVEIGYHLTLSNGRGPVEYQDFDEDKAVGGRLYLKTDAIGSLTVGASIYRGGYYDRSAKYVIIKDGTTVDQTYATISKYQELSLGADLKWEYKSWLVQGEAIMNEANFANDGRPRSTVLKPPQGFQADYRRWGAYGLVGYRLPFELMPYVIVQHAFSPDSPTTPPATAYELGVNYRPTAAVVVKLEYTDWHFSAPGAAGLGNYPLRILASQVAWAF
ncbi:MAG TPA: hypothetical protein VFK05_07610 [Polyangiaceae bacterium]|nr:hypothetical protein [Polyangiaceae bacterium]